MCMVQPRKVRGAAGEAVVGSEPSQDTGTVLVIEQTYVAVLVVASNASLCCLFVQQCQFSVLPLPISSIQDWMLSWFQLYWREKDPDKLHNFYLWAITLWWLSLHAGNLSRSPSSGASTFPARFWCRTQLPNSEFIILVDGAVNKSRFRVTAGCVGSSSQGVPFGSASFCAHGDSPLVAEILAIRLGIWMVGKWRMKSVTILYDAKAVVDALSQPVVVFPALHN
ncbi:hypothetical protein HHK36_021806 [Tetracentron sinense]|uniref:RNase H type-1 domain-containing protein n=1 Tax=Tetracentron sinense TaxID=13715 RepID=A0A834YXN1_TETSI|nr:hypothetical protein HHK36_021806 [Tetracentron sinense]